MAILVDLLIRLTTPRGVEKIRQDLVTRGMPARHINVVVTGHRHSRDYVQFECLWIAQIAHSLEYLTD